MKKALSKIMMTMDAGKDVYYRAACGCADGEHDTSLEVKYDDELNILSLTFWQKVRWGDWAYAKTWMGRGWHRIKKAVEILVTGTTELESEFLFDDREQVADFLSALYKGENKMPLWCHHCNDAMETEGNGVWWCPRCNMGPAADLPEELRGEKPEEPPNRLERELFAPKEGNR